MLGGAGGGEYQHNNLGEIFFFFFCGLEGYPRCILYGLPPPFFFFLITFGFGEVGLMKC